MVVLTLACGAARGMNPPGIADVERLADRRADVIDRVDQTVVLVYGENPQEGGGSGVLIDPAGFALTNFHVVMGAGGTEGWAGLDDGRLRRWRLIGVDPGGDLAVIQLLGDQPYPYALMGDSDAVVVGQAVMAMGNPFAVSQDQTPTVTMGIVSGTHRFQGGEGGSSLLVYGDCIQVDTSINPGNSGGPLFDMNGRLIGINGRASFSFVERGRVNVGLGYAIGINQARRFLGDMLATKVAEHATLDAVFGDRGGKVVCTEIDYGRCPLADHGFELGDELIGLGGRRIDSANAVLNVLTTVPAGWPVRVVWRSRADGAQQEAVVRLNTLVYDKPPSAAEPPPDPGDDGKDQRAPQARGRVNFGEPGEVRNATLNREIARLLLRRADPDRFPEARLDSLARLELHGSDRIAGEPTVRIELADANDHVQRVWLGLDPARSIASPTVAHHIAGRATPMLARAVGDNTLRDVREDSLGDSASLLTPAALDARRKTVKIIGAGIGREQGYATGVIVSPLGRILTAEGLPLAASRLRVVLPDGSVHLAEVVRRDDAIQAALLQIDAMTPRFFELEDKPTAAVGDWVMAVANPFQVAELAEPLSVNLGVVSLRAELDTRRRATDFDVRCPILLIDAITANPGSPGGALVTVDGRLAGMVGKVLESESTNTRLNYAIPNDVLADFVAGRPTTPTEPEADDAEPDGGPVELGIRLFKLSGRRAPAYVDRVVAGSPADRAGIRRDDLVLTVNDEWVRTVEEYEQAVGELRRGADVLLVVKRGQQVLRLTLATGGEEAGQ